MQTGVKFLRYHKDVEFPPRAKLGNMLLDFFENFELINVSYHGRNQLVDDRKGVIIKVPSKTELMNPANTLVEVFERADDSYNPLGIIQKVLIRCHNLHEDWDFAYVVAREGLIVSAWANDKSDHHRLIRKDIYYSTTFNDYVEVPEVLLGDDDDEE